MSNFSLKMLQDSGTITPKPWQQLI